MNSDIKEIIKKLKNINNLYFQLLKFAEAMRSNMDIYGDALAEYKTFAKLLSEVSNFVVYTSKLSYAERVFSRWDLLERVLGGHLSNISSVERMLLELKSLSLPYSRDEILSIVDKYMASLYESQPSKLFVSIRAATKGVPSIRYDGDNFLPSLHESFIELINMIYDLYENKNSILFNIVNAVMDSTGIELGI